jgi:hypothetical protein
MFVCKKWYAAAQSPSRLQDSLLSAWSAADSSDTSHEGPPWRLATMYNERGMWRNMQACAYNLNVVAAAPLSRCLCSEVGCTCCPPPTHRRLSCSCCACTDMCAIHSGHCRPTSSIDLVLASDLISDVRRIHCGVKQGTFRPTVAHWFQWAGEMLTAAPSDGCACV